MLLVGMNAGGGERECCWWGVLLLVGRGNALGGERECCWWGERMLLAGGLFIVWRGIAIDGEVCSWQRELLVRGVRSMLEFGLVYKGAAGKPELRTSPIGAGFTSRCCSHRPSIEVNNHLSEHWTFSCSSSELVI